MPVKSPYNFVPAPTEKEVFNPDWADQVSHDIPFSDGESGEIDIKITAETPIFIRNGHSKGDAETFRSYLERVNKNKDYRPTTKEQKRIERYLSFSNYEGKYFIPSTSLKGMFRNVLEIITSSRMNRAESISKINPITYGMRDMNNPEYTGDNAKVRSGWLIKGTEGWMIKSCTNHKLALSDIERKFNLSRGELKDSGINKNKLCGKHIKNKIFQFSFSKDLGKWVGKQYNFDNGGDFEGYIVLYGDIDNKRYDYIFSKPSGDGYQVDSVLIDILDNIENNGENKEDSLWLYFRKEDWQPGIPVFFTLNTDNKSVKHFGLTKLYRRNNSHYLHNLEPFKSYLKGDEKDKLDFAESLFGSVRTEALKGRVFISHAWSDNAKAGNQEERILNSPKPSFYPAYLKQEGVKGELKGAYKTYHSADAELRGFKRYPVHGGIKPNIESDNENIASQFIPLKEGTVFTGKIRYFNLRPCEIGALVSAITFHGNSDNFFHSIGGVKPYGLGKINIEIKDSDQFSKYLADFEFIMNEHLGENEFINQENIRELLSIASSSKSAEIDSLLDYPLIEKEIMVRGVDKKINEFNLYKQDKDQNGIPKNKQFLESYSERNGEYPIHSHLDKEFFRKKEEFKIEQRKKEKDEFDKIANTKDISEIEQFINTNPDSIYKSYAEELIKKISSEQIQAESKRKEEEEAERIRIKRIQEAENAKEEGLQIETDLTHRNAFDNFSKEIMNYIKKLHKNNNEKWLQQNLENGKALLISDQNAIINAIRVIYEHLPNKNEIRKWHNPFENNAVFKKITWWLGDEKSQSIYNDLTNP